MSEPPQAAELPLDDDVEAEDDAEAAGLESVFDEADPVDESDALEDDVVGVLLDEEPRLSFR